MYGGDGLLREGPGAGWFGDARENVTLIMEWGSVEVSITNIRSTRAY